MIAIIKKYWFHFTYITVIIGLHLFYIPHEKARYLQQDFKKLESKSNVVTVWIVIVLCALILVFALKHTRKIAEAFHVVLGIAAVSLPLYFLFRGFVLSSALFLNGLAAKETPERSYLVVYTDPKQKMLILLDKTQHSSFDGSQLIKSDRNLELMEADTVFVSFKNGLFGSNYDPTIREIRSPNKDRKIVDN